MGLNGRVLLLNQTLRTARHRQCGAGNNHDVQEHRYRRRTCLLISRGVTHPGRTATVWERGVRRGAWASRPDQMSDMLQLVVVPQWSRLRKSATS
jgi:hypothetical protein